MTISTSSTTLPELPLTCLNTAEFQSTSDAFKGKNTVIGTLNLSVTSSSIVLADSACIMSCQATCFIYDPHNTLNDIFFLHLFRQTFGPQNVQDAPPPLTI